MTPKSASMNAQGCWQDPRLCGQRCTCCASMEAMVVRPWKLKVCVYARIALVHPWTHKYWECGHRRTNCSLSILCECKVCMASCYTSFKYHFSVYWNVKSATVQKQWPNKTLATCQPQYCLWNCGNKQSTSVHIRRRLSQWTTVTTEHCSLNSLFSKPHQGIVTIIKKDARYCRYLNGGNNRNCKALD